MKATTTASIALFGLIAGACDAEVHSESAFRAAQAGDSIEAIEVHYDRDDGLIGEIVYDDGTVAVFSDHILRLEGIAGESQESQSEGCVVAEGGINQGVSVLAWARVDGESLLELQLPDACEDFVAKLGDPDASPYGIDVGITSDDGGVVLHLTEILSMELRSDPIIVRAVDTEIEMLAAPADQRP